MHQFDLLYMPTDTLYGNEYKYVLSGINISSRVVVVVVVYFVMNIMSDYRDTDNKIQVYRYN